MRHRLAVIRTGLDRPRVWRATAALAGLLLCVVVIAASEGSLDVIAQPPAAEHATRTASWERWCADGRVRKDRRQLAFCARVDGLVLASSKGPGDGEVHVAVVGDFHLTIVRLPDWARTPSIGTRVIAIGPMLRARDGQREVQAFKLVRG
jgi:hypothetical protein